MKKLLYIISLALLTAGCSKDDTPSYYLDELVIDTANCLAEGSYVQGSACNEYCFVRIPYENAQGGTALVFAPETNGLRIDEQSVTLTDGSGEMQVAVQGMPLLLETSFLQINVRYRDKTYLSSVEIAVLEDVDPSGTITFEIDDAPVASLTEALELPFTVEPSMTAVVAVHPEIAGLRVAIVTDPKTGSGTLTLTPAANFLGGTVELVATFGSREAQRRTIDVSAFAEGDGTPEAPFAVASDADLARLAYGLDQAFALTADLELPTDWTPVGSAANPFTGSFDGGDNTLTLALDRPDASDLALFAALGSGAEVKNLTLKGSVRGGQRVAALAAASEIPAPATVDVSAVTVTGDNIVAAAIASGAGADARVLRFGNPPTAVNIPMGETTASGSLELEPQDAVVTFDAGETGSTWSYSSATGEFTVTKGDAFAAGTVSYYASLNDRVRTTARTIAITSKNMYESGTGVSGDPYIVTDADQFTATVHTYPAAHIKLTENIELTETWETVTEFSGSLDGDHHTVKGLTEPLVGTNSGTIENLRFTDVTIATSSTESLGVIARISTGTIRSVGVKGTIDVSSTGDRQVGGIAGQINAGTISNCYVNAEITVSCTGVGGIAGFFNGSTAEGARVEYCTTEGSITWRNNATRIGGIVGRKNTNAGGADYITNCLSSMILSGTSADSGSNMNGGIFGVSSSGHNDKRLYIQQCLFTGRIKGAACAGGIAGLGPDIQDCMVLSDGFESGEATVQTTTSNNGSSGGIAAGAKGDIARCIVSGARLIGTGNTSGIVTVQNNGSPTVKSCVVLDSSVTAGGKAIYGETSSTKITVSDSYYCGMVYGDGSPYEPSEENCDGKAVEKAQLTQSWYEGLGYDFTDVWTWDAANGLPKLQHVGCDDNVKIN